MGLGTDDGDKYFCSLKVHNLMTLKQRRTVLLFDIARLPLDLTLGTIFKFTHLSLHVARIQVLLQLRTCKPNRHCVCINSDTHEQCMQSCNGLLVLENTKT